MKRFLFILTSVIICIGVYGGSALAADLVIADGGSSSYSIVLPEGATDVQNYAAKELRDYIAKISGATLPVVSEQELTGPGIFIGGTARGREIVGAPELEQAGREGFVIRSNGADIAVVGGGPRGTLYGVYSLLEDTLGCKWYAPDYEYVPSMKKISVPQLDYTQKPAFEYREPFFHHAFDGTWAARNRVNGSRPTISKEMGGKITYSHFVHTFYSLVPPEKYFKEHPEYFSEIGGERVGSHAQLCLTNPDVIKIATQQVLKWIEENPDATIFSVSQNDWIGNCQCEKCRRVDEAEGTPMGTLLNFVNAIADEVAKKYPDKLIDTLAYIYTEVPPKTIRPRRNVCIRLCHMQPSCDLHPLDDSIYNMRYVDNLKKWSKLTDRIYVWHYVTNFSHYLAPFPDLNAIIKDIPYYRKHGVVGYFGQGSYQSDGGNLAELKAWLIAKMLWNPELDGRKLISEFVNAYYGKAAVPIMKYYVALHKHARRKSVTASLYSDPSGYLTADLVKLGAEAFAEAEKLAADDPALLKRVKRAGLGITYVQLRKPHLLGWSREQLAAGGEHDQWARFEQFQKNLAELNVNRIAEFKPLDQSISLIREEIEKQVAE
ncbi:MAG TPA: DUF4838 domain-containing protein [bacterium]|nr:DUF4838 domain-containing protein [bacterium]